MRKIKIFLFISLILFHKNAYSLDEDRLFFLNSKGKSERSGPNCHNTVLFLKNIVQGIRYTSNEEIRAALNAYCKLLSDNQTPQRGDIGIVISPDKDFLHSFIYLDKSTYFSKTGWGSYFPYEIIDIKGLIYSGAEGSCDGCDNKILRYRCSSTPKSYSFSSDLISLETSFQDYAFAKSHDFYPNPEQLKTLGKIKQHTLRTFSELEKIKFQNALEKEFFHEALKSMEYNVDRWIEPDDDD